MKKLLIVVLTVAMLFSLSGCKVLGKLTGGKTKETVVTTLPDDLLEGTGTTDSDEEVTTTVPVTTTTEDPLTTTTTLLSGVQIPDIYDVDEASAKNILLANMLIPQIKYENSDAVTAGNVLRVEPEIGSFVEKNSKVTVYVSQGPRGIDLLLESYDSDSTHVADIALSNDSTFEMQINLYEGYGKMYGVYVMNNGTISCTVSGKDFYGFVGDHLQYFTLTPVGGDKYSIDLYNVEYLGALEDGDLFN